MVEKIKAVGKYLLFPFVAILFVLRYFVKDVTSLVRAKKIDKSNEVLKSTEKEYVEGVKDAKDNKEISDSLYDSYNNKYRSGGGSNTTN